MRNLLRNLHVLLFSLRIVNNNLYSKFSVLPVMFSRYHFGEYKDEYEIFEVRLSRLLQ